MKQLSDENRILLEKLEYFKELNNASIILTSDSSNRNITYEIQQLNKTLYEYKEKNRKLEENLKSIMQENFYKEIICQREKMQKEVS